MGMSLSDDMKAYLKASKGEKTKPIKRQIEAVPDSDLAKSELMSALHDIKYEFGQILSVIKLIFIGASLFLNIISWSIYSSWNEFVGSQEYKQFLLKKLK